MKFIDTHAHMYSHKFDSDRDEVIQRCIGSGIERIYLPNVDLQSIPGMLALEDRYPGVCFPTIGLHPCEVKPGFEDVLAQMETWIGKRTFAGIGETGIDLYWDKSTYDLQVEALKIQIEWAKNMGWPIILHCRESMEETIKVIRSEHSKNLKGIFHCFSGTLHQAREIMEMGFYLGIGGTVTYRNNGVGKVIEQIGLESVVLETDAPYLAPVPQRGKRNTPEYLPYVAEALARHLGVEVEQVASQTYFNALSVFNSLKDEL